MTYDLDTCMNYIKLDVIMLFVNVIGVVKDSVIFI